MRSLKDKIILITGSSIGIGRETAYLCAREGGRLVITYYRDKKEAQATIEKCRDLGASEVFLVRLDVTDSESVETVVDKVVSKFAVRGFTKALAEELDIKVISVNPPLTTTRMSGYKGMPVEYVAGIIRDTAINCDEIESSGDVNVERK